MDTAKIVHLIGIGGCGMSAIAKILRELGKTVQGSDTRESPNTIRLKDQGIKVFIGHSGPNVRGADVVVYSSAIPNDNEEIKSAKSQRITVISRAEALSWIMDQFPSRIAVAGTHGKTTTTSMIATMLTRAGLDPTYLVGAEADTVTGNAQLGKGKFSVAEADESDGSFLKLHPTTAVVTNIEADHMDHYKTMQNLLRTFEEFIQILPKTGTLIINIDNKNAADVARKFKDRYKTITYGLVETADIRATEISHERDVTHYKVTRGGKLLGEVVLSVPGLQNVANSLAAIAFGLDIGMDLEAIKEGLRSFRGVKRRFQTIGEIGNIMIIDDYAHHPTEIEAVLKAARLGWKKERRLICVFQPHRYTRTMYLHDSFARAFIDADLVVITEIYSAGEKPIEGVSAELVAEAVRAQMGDRVSFIPKKDAIVDYLLKTVKDGDMVITAGAGDIYTVGKELYNRLRSRSGT